MRHLNWHRWTRYFLVGVLVTGLAVNTATARRLFQRRSRVCACHHVCEVCSTACPVTSSIAPCGCSDGMLSESVIVSDGPCAAVETTVVDSPCQNYVSEIVPDYAQAYDSSPIVVDEFVGEPLFETSPTPTEWHEPAESYAPAEITGSPIVESPVAPPVAQPITPPAPVDTPEVAAPEASSPTETSELVAPPSTSPPVEDSTAAGGVGDRYSNSNDLFPPTTPPATPAESPAPTPAPAQEDPTQKNPIQKNRVEVEPAATDSGMDDMFDEPISPPTRNDDTPRVREPQPQPDVDDLFGPAESPEAAELTEASNAAEPPEVVNEETPEAEPLPSQELTPVEPAPADSDKDDPFGEDWTTSADDQTSVLKEAGGLLSKTERTWTDNTASFRCEARLLRVTAKNVVLQQSYGAERVVPIARLANVDLQFIRKQITALRIMQTRDTTAEKLLAVVWGK